MPRPALLPADHPLAYSYVEPASRLHRASPYSIKDQVHYMFERQNITDLLNNYAYTLDVCMVDSSAADRWAALFTDDCNVTYPFGTHVGTEGLAKWCLNAELRFHRMMASHLSSNYTILFNSETVAHGRSALFAVCGTHPEDMGQIFSEGGYYYWSFRKELDGWKISYLFLDVNWVSGDSKGLNEPAAAEEGSKGPTD
ncbi:uncharacterized protein A1O9_03177 [Exophiala aquamarina CBS 119918]|uniref:SnoaL-like domain-containing protein n=1 Tax=Exophiala aquamarina CBS 119918 TaxID=1182545 RepID=A0A072PNE0_9EURO|nr:uncharacterized protein A1O9_03177 [Exophiala aquamarina CBS 119918]KEF61609.1 hypothetical protein A1O9_03177 [Exophiala aquamarina CBS 119918]